MYGKYLKRALDIVLSFVALVFLAVPLLFIAALVKFTSPGPVLFRQVRCGRDNQPFVFYKFRTMLTHAPQLATRDFRDADEYITIAGGYYANSHSTNCRNYGTCFVVT